ncbi:hypothetical protein TNCV_2534251 [Trichonephila clavipes]|nr:hypothetical protein TNCV_2534251 [Trichonephila clavipes]
MGRLNVHHRLARRRTGIIKHPHSIEQGGLRKILIVFFSKVPCTCLHVRRKDRELKPNGTLPASSQRLMTRSEDSSKGGHAAEWARQ